MLEFFDMRRFASVVIFEPIFEVLKHIVGIHDSQSVQIKLCMVNRDAKARFFYLRMQEHFCPLLVRPSFECLSFALQRSA